MNKILILIAGVLLAGCAGTHPKGSSKVDEFDAVKVDQMSGNNVSRSPMQKVILCLNARRESRLVTATTNVAAAFAALAIAMPDVAVLDFELGLETSESIAEVVRARNGPFVFLSGHSEHDERFGRCPGIRVLAKPLSAATVARGIEDILKAR